MEEKLIASLLTYGLISLFLFLLFRHFLTWYWKINEIVTLLKKANENIERTNLLLQSANEDRRKSTGYIVDEIKSAAIKKNNQKVTP